jgi:hypothetical protein
MKHWLNVQQNGQTKIGTEKKTDRSINNEQKVQTNKQTTPHIFNGAES